MLLNLILGEVNWSNISSDWGSFVVTGYAHIFGNWTYPLCFLGLIGYIYCLSKSATTAAAGIAILFAVYGATGVFGYPEVAGFSFLGWIIVVFSFAGIFTVLFVTVGKRKGW